MLRAAGNHQLIVDRQHSTRQFQGLLAARGQADARRFLLDEISAEAGLQFPHMGADGRLRQIEQLSGLGEAAELIDRDECPQQLGRDIDRALPETGLTVLFGIEDDVGSARTRLGHAMSLSDRVTP